MSGAEVRRWARSLADQGLSRVDALAAVGDIIEWSCAKSSGHEWHGELVDCLPTPPGGWANPWLLGVAHEQLEQAEDRKSRGAWYTPREVVEGLVAVALAGPEVPAFVVDPTCGGGAFLLAALDRLVDLGLAPADAITRVAGIDLDKRAVNISQRSIKLWASLRGLDFASIVVDVSQGDALEGFPSHWPRPLVVVGNPPFASPLRKGVIPESAAQFRSHHNEVLSSYTDLSALHLYAAVCHAGPGSAVLLVQPQSVLASQDTGLLREALEYQAPIEALWVARESVFDAGVRVCAPLLLTQPEPKPAQHHSDPQVGHSSVQLWSGPRVEGAGSSERAPWSSYAARALGAPPSPSVCWDTPRRLGELVTATAGFRDEYYGLLASCNERSELDNDADGVAQSSERLVTVGSVDPLTTTWGVKPIRLGRRDWHQPVVDRSSLEPKVLRWVERQAKPKVVLATQSKILEPLIDWDGTLVPMTPLIAVHADQGNLAMVAAVLLAPPVVAWAWERWFGTAMAVDALKLAAKQVVDLPLPPDQLLWEKAAKSIADASLLDEPEDHGNRSKLIDDVAMLMTEAYGADESVYRWWKQRAGLL